MSKLPSIALRNLSRQARRTALSAGSVLIAVCAVVLLRGMANGLLRLLADNVVDAGVGAIQVHAPGFLEAESDPLKLDLPDEPALYARIAAVPGVAAVTPRLTFDALIGNGSVSTLAQVVAVDPAREAKVCPHRWDEAHGQGLDKPDAAEAVVGEGLGTGLGAKAGDTLNIMTGTRAGAQNALDFTVRTLMVTADPFSSKRRVIVPLKFAQSVAGMGGRVTEIAIAVRDSSAVETVAARLSAELGPKYDVRTWKVLVPSVQERLVRLGRVLAFISVVLFIMVLSGIVNTMLMTVYERVREIGTMLAVGAKRRQIVALFMLEAAGLGAVGASAGGIIGYAFIRWLGARGIALPIPGQAFSLELHASVSFAYVLGAIGVGVVGALVAAAYPSWRASRLTPVEALRAI